MGQKQSKEKLLYHYVINGDVGGIEFLSKQGTGLEWKDKEGKTPLIVAAKDPGLYDMARTLIELGANVNAFCKGRQGGTPLHYAAKEGLDNTVALLLLHGANAFVKNRENQTPLDVARKNGHNHVVRQIESRICYFAGPIREKFGPGLSDVSAPQSSSTSAVIWVVVVPRSPHNPPRPQKLELVIYSTAQDAEPRKIISLRRSKIKAPRFDQPSPALTIFDKQTKNRYKFSSITYDDKQQLRRLYNACKGISQVMPASAQMMIPETINSSPLHTTSSHITSPAWTTPRIFSPPMTPNNNNNNNIWVHESPRSKLNSAPNRSPTAAAAVSSPVPSAPPINTTSINTPVSDESADFTVCVVCWEAPVEGACIPCGHVSTCMSCLKKIKDNNGVCPVCRGEIDQVVKLYGI
ncbi:putative E3 ubiquitin-protein ligase XBAT35 isoform X1 [Spinacia oleracea]|uniref:E3 ubiquitin-protein ligase XBAT35 isoform X1 n=1 Tax=Spinacia oleracea TaxID=3562 RepID=A0A9R0IVF2_SPIOL|nr:putative E3 ubiquitin-protein ligase XBAT35 isoform X1 [Spinacia oleracea]